ncbi:MAG: OadG family transporter subunit [Ruminococcus sp.]
MDINTIVAASLSLGEKFSISITTLLTGFVVVFAVLILLILIISIYGKICYTVQNSSKEKKAKKDKVEKQEAPAPVKTAPAPSSVSGISDEIVAVIAAAVDSTYGVGNAKIKSIKKSPSVGRPVWGQAGVLDNTRPF